MADETKQDPALAAEVAADDAAAAQEFIANNAPRYTLETLQEANTTSKRVDLIERMMRALQWERGKSANRLAGVWKCSRSTVENYSAEAWRRVKVTLDPEAIRESILTGGNELIAQAVARGRARDFAEVSNVLMQATGIGKVQQESPPATVNINVRGPSNGESKDS
jgi:predicted Zn-dependent protease